MKAIRNSAKAIIIRDGKILCLKHQYSESLYHYGLPGGGQHHGETITEALKRECLEEISAEVEIGDILFVRDYIGKNHDFSEDHCHVHQIEYMFSCDLKTDIECKPGSEPDNNQVGVEWLPLDRLEEYDLFPKALRPVLAKGLHQAGVVYLGDVN